MTRTEVGSTLLVLIVVIVGVIALWPRDAAGPTAAPAPVSGAPTARSDPAELDQARARAALEACPAPAAAPAGAPLAGLTLDCLGAPGAVDLAAALPGRVTLVNLWASWCGPCREEIPLLNTLRKERAADKLEVVGIAIDEQQAVLKFAKEIGIQYPVLMGEQEGYEAAEKFGVASLVLPFSVFVDSQGRIVTLKVGELHPDQAAAILDRVRDVDANRLTLADARRQIADKLRDLASDPSKDNDEGPEEGHEHGAAGG